jgi:murein tripeptide amidase MpaA
MSDLKKVVTLLIIFLIMMPGWAIEKYEPSEGYHNYSALSKALKDLVAKNKKISKLISIGQTLNKRDIWALQITGAKSKSANEKQALLICGNIEANHLIGGEVALGIADFLIANYGKDEQVTRTLDNRTFYIIPRLNPDGAEQFFSKILNESPGNTRPRDDDYDWAVNEDGPEDLNGDGFITQMRVKDKEGEWTINKKDNRLMKKKESDTPVDSLYNIYPEGIDNDGDELYNEDGAGGFNINRNFPHNFGYKIKGVKVYPVSENETKALIDFMNRYDPEVKNAPRKNICGVLIFSKYDNLAAGTGIESGEATFPEVKRNEAQTTQRSFRFGRRRSGGETSQKPAKDPQDKKTEKKDENLFKKVSDKYKKITGIDHAVSEKPVGSMLEWSYFQYGVPSFSANLWSLRKEKKEKPDSTTKEEKKEVKEKPGKPDRRAMMAQRFSGKGGAKSGGSKKLSNNDEKWLKWIDKQNDGKGFVNWEKFQHKQLGEVEIGGFFPYLRTNPPAGQIDSLAQSHAKFALYLASQFAEIKMDKPVVEKMSSNLFRLKIKIHNKGKFPYATAMGEKSRNISPIVLQLKFEDDKKMKLFGGTKRMDLRSLDPGAEKEYEWVIISPPGKKIAVKLWARNGGGTTKEKVVLK